MSIPFSCPHCGTKSEVADQYGGQTGPCGKCGQTITIPTLGAPNQATAPPQPAKKSSAAPIVLGIVALFCVVAVPVAGVLVAMLLPAVQAARGAARRAQCANNMKQIGLALHMYNSEYGTFPPAYVADEDGNPAHGWRVLILPYLEQKALYDQYDFSVSWDNPNNAGLASQMPMIYRCPSDTNGNSVDTAYLAVTGTGTMFEGGRAPGVDVIRDGMSNTIMMVEAGDSFVNWMAPVDIDVADLGMTENFHPGGFNALFADSSVQFMSDSVDPETLRELSSCASGNPVMVP